MSTWRLTTEATATNPIVGDLYLNDAGQPELIGKDINNGEDYALSVAQNIRTRIQFVKGEWYLDQRQGTPWFEKLLVKGVSAETLKSVIGDVVKGTPGVQELRGMDVSFNAQTRVATITNLIAVTDTREVVTIGQLDQPFIVEVPLA